MMDKDLFLTIKQCKLYKTVGNDLQYYIFKDNIKQKIYIIFQESRSKIDWKVNFNFPSKVYKRQSKFYLVHRGYVKSWKSCNDIIMNELISFIQSNPNYEVVISGWSYGGAISQLCAEDLYYRTKIKPTLITFGSPKILYFLFSKKHFENCCKEIKQYYQPNDFVTWMMPFFFVHHLNKVKCGDNFNIKKLFNTEYLHMHYNEVL